MAPFKLHLGPPVVEQSQRPRDAPGPKMPRPGCSPESDSEHSGGWCIPDTPRDTASKELNNAANNASLLFLLLSPPPPMCFYFCLGLNRNVLGWVFLVLLCFFVGFILFVFFGWAYIVVWFLYDPQVPNEIATCSREKEFHNRMTVKCCWNPLG